jgi:hypothetical protein
MLNELKVEQALRRGYEDYFEKMHKIGGELHKILSDCVSTPNPTPLCL